MMAVAGLHSRWIHTMIRCALAFFVAALVAGLAPAQTTVQRPFPAVALRGEIAFGQPPEIQLNGQPARLSPGARIRGANNLILMSGALLGYSAVVHYVVDSTGLVHDVWILTDAERAKLPWPKTAQEAQSWSFDPVAQTWTAR
jgi:hypothetical protein